MLLSRCLIKSILYFKTLLDFHKFFCQKKCCCYITLDVCCWLYGNLNRSESEKKPAFVRVREREERKKKKTQKKELSRQCNAILCHNCFCFCCMFLFSHLPSLFSLPSPFSLSLFPVSYYRPFFSLSLFHSLHFTRFIPLLSFYISHFNIIYLSLSFSFSRFIPPSLPSYSFLLIRVTERSRERKSTKLRCIIIFLLICFKIYENKLIDYNR